ncbi:MAG: hypothetical protein WCR54_07795 [Clostridia bacterium]
MNNDTLIGRAEKEGIVNCEGRHFYVKAIKSAKGKIWLKETGEDMGFSKDAGKYGTGRTFPLWNHMRGMYPWLLLSEFRNGMKTSVK